MRFYVIGLIGTLLSASANAEPATAAAALSWISSYGVYVAAAVAITATVYGSANARRQAREAAQKARDDANAALQDRRITAVSDAMPLRFIYGKARVGSVVVAQFTSGDKDQFKHLVCVHAAHECDGFEDFWVAGHSMGQLTAIGNPETGSRYAQSNQLAYHKDFTGTTTTLALTPDPGSLYVIKRYPWMGSTSTYAQDTLVKVNPALVSVVGNTVTVAGGSGDYRVVYLHTESISGVNVRVHLGGASDPVDSYLHGLFPTQWPDTSVLRGYCYSVVTLNLNNPEFQSGIPSIEILLRGRRDIYDPRNGSTGYSKNVALCLANYLEKYCDIPRPSIPTSNLIAAANVCDEIITINDGTTGAVIGAARYNCNGSDTTDTDPATVIDQMATAMCGGIDATTFEMFAGTYTASIGTLVAEDVVGAISLSPALSDADLSNGYKGQAALIENDYVSGDYTPYQNAAYFISDGIETWNSLTLPWTNNTQRVHNICRILTEDARNAFTVKAEFSLKALKYKIGDRVGFTFPLFMFTNKVFRVTDKTYTASGTVELTLKEDTAEIWDEADAVVVDATPNSDAPDPWRVDPINGLTATSGTATLEKLLDGTVRPRLLVSWQDVGRDDVTIELQVEDVSTGVKTIYTSAPDETQTYVTNVSEFSVYVVRACAINNFSQARSAYRWLVADVVGKSEPPSPVEGASVTVVTGGAKIAWQLPIDIDWSETEWRYGTSFNAGTRIYRGTATECIWLSPAQGTYQLWGVNYDTSGIRSTTPTQLTLVFGANGLISWDNISNTIGSGSNLIFNSSFDKSPKGVFDWSTYSSGGWSRSSEYLISIDMAGVNYSETLHPSGAGSGSGCFFMHQSGMYGSGGGNGYAEACSSETIAVEAGKTYCLSAYLGTWWCNAVVFAFGYNSSGAITGALFWNDCNDGEAAGGADLNDYKRAYSFATIPVGVTHVGIMLRKYNTNPGHADSWLFATRLMLEEVSQNVSTPGPWSDSGALLNGGVSTELIADFALLKSERASHAGPLYSGSGGLADTYTVTPTHDCLAQVFVTYQIANSANNLEGYLQARSGGAFETIESIQSSPWTQVNQTAKQSCTVSAIFPVTANKTIQFRLYGAGTGPATEHTNISWVVNFHKKTS